MSLYVTTKEQCIFLHLLHNPEEPTNNRINVWTVDSPMGLFVYYDHLTTNGDRI